ncbi:MAG: hypothetical protein JO316_10760 [Abitibacteriaceae bacterium]|nr:hypothetical protein [Abditibacteriaceae bacterium]MBV9865824.1 hypothetical protein [Abditibacteriaceae bacterium]
MHSGFFLVSDILTTLIGVAAWLVAVGRLAQKGWYRWQRVTYLLFVIAIPLLIYSTWSDAEAVWSWLSGGSLTLLSALIYTFNHNKLQRDKIAKST